jgi:hypothetical protein
MATGALPLESVIGFEGKVGGGLVLHPNGKTMAYPLGATVVVKELGDSYSQSFFQGHTDEVSCLAISRDGRYLASGQITNMGFAADIIVWDVEARAILHRMSLHKVKVAELAFSYDGTYLASLGGQDDNSLVIWDVASGNAVCGTPAPGLTKCLRFFNNTNFRLVTGGGNTLVVWDFDLANRKLRPTPCRMGSIRRDTNYIVVDEEVRARPRPHGQIASRFGNFFFPRPRRLVVSSRQGETSATFRFVGERGLGPASSPVPFRLPSLTLPAPFRDPRLIRMNTCTRARRPAMSSR